MASHSLRNPRYVPFASTPGALTVCVDHNATATAKIFCSGLHTKDLVHLREILVPLARAGWLGSSQFQPSFTCPDPFLRGVRRCDEAIDTAGTLQLDAHGGGWSAGEVLRIACICQTVVSKCGWVCFELRICSTGIPRIDSASARSEGWERHGRHDHDRLPLSGGHQHVEADLKFRCPHVIGVSPERDIAPTPVRRIPLCMPKPAQFREVSIAHPGLTKRLGKGLAIQLWMMSRSRNGPHLSHPLDSLCSKAIQECVDGPSRMPDGTYGSSTTSASSCGHDTTPASSRRSSSK